MIINTKYLVSQEIVRACSVFYPCERCRSVTPLDAARVNRTIYDFPQPLCALILHNPHKV